MKKILIFIAFCAAVVSLSVRGQKIEAYRGVINGGYNFWLAEPVDTGGPKPVIIFLHGASLCGSDLAKVKRYGTIDALERGREIDAYVIAPQNPGGSWRPGKVHDILDWVSARHDIDSTRIYVMGMSLGGYGTIDYAATYPDEVAAALGMCGGATVKNLGDLNNVPLWIVHGTGDRAVTVKQSDRVVEAMVAANDSTPRLIYDRVPGMDHGRPARLFYLPEIYEWLFSHSLDQEDRPVHETAPVSNELLSRAYAGLKSKPGSSRKSKSVRKSNKKRSRSGNRRRRK